MKKIILLPSLMLFFSAATMAQKIFYYDSSMQKTAAEKAYIRGEVTENNSGVVYKTYFIANQNLRSEASFKDTTFKGQFGAYKSFYEDGKLQDSSMYTNESQRLYAYHYFPNGKLQAEYHFDPSTEKETVKGYDDAGNEIKDFVFEQEAEFKGGPKAWSKYLGSTLNPDVPIRKKAKGGVYQVVVRFIIQPDGNVGSISAETSHGHGMEQEAIRVIRKSPKWNAAVQYNKPVNAYRRQPITFVVQDK